MEESDHQPHSATHHQHIWVDFVHLRQEESKQSALSSSYLHFPILKEKARHVSMHVVDKGQIIIHSLFDKCFVQMFNIVLSSTNRNVSYIF